MKAIPVTATDVSGNQTLKSNATSVLTFGWDGANRCVAITNGIYRTAIAYDGANRWTRITEYSNSVVIADRRFIWNGVTLAEERDASNNVIQRFFPDGFQRGGTNYFYVKDHLGSVREVYSQSGALQARFDYDPYGNKTQTYGTLRVDFGFAGLFELKNGLTLAVWRIYDPSTARWLSKDPIKEDGGLNVYQYCFNDPINHVDIDGQNPLVTGAIGAGIGATVGAFSAWSKGGDWRDIGYGALRGGIVGGVTGLTLGFGGAALAGTFGGGISGGAFAGAVASGVGDLAAQSLDNIAGIRCGFSGNELGKSMLIGGVFGGVLLRPYTAPQQTVSSWAKASQPDVNPGRWVMVGGRSIGNYLRTVGPAMRRYPYGNSISTPLPGSSLAYPPGASGNFAGLLGQRIIER